MTIARNLWLTVRARLGAMSFRTGVIVAVACVLCYVLSFAQMLLPTSAAVKGIVWATFYGMAKTLQYTAILILGKEGVKRIRSWWGQR